MEDMVENNKAKVIMVTHPTCGCMAEPFGSGEGLRKQVAGRQMVASLTCI